MIYLFAKIRDFINYFKILKDLYSNISNLFINNYKFVKITNKKQIFKYIFTVLNIKLYYLV